MDGIIQIILGGIMLYVAFGIVKQIAKTAFYITAIAAVLTLLWGTADAVGIDLSTVFAQINYYGCAFIQRILILIFN